VTVDHYAAAAPGWSSGAELVYRPIARELVAMSPHPLAGRQVLDVGAGTGAASSALSDLGARPVAIDLSHHMLAWDRSHRPPAAVGDVSRLPVRDDAVDDVVAAFVYNHLRDPVSGLAEARRVVRPGGAVLACTFSNTPQSAARDVLDAVARDAGWTPPEWYTENKQNIAPLLGSATAMERVAAAAGLVDVVVDERPVDVGITTAPELVDYRLGQVHYTSWLDELGPDRAAEVRLGLIEAIAPVMAPFLPIVVFLVALDAGQPDRDTP
jgi:ubiquinone/menaquinone biosynthesis C-methylase UbiE